LYNIVGVGKSVKTLMESFGQHKEYKTFYLDEDMFGDYSSMQEYEDKFPLSSVKKALKGITKKSEVLYVMEGGSHISGVSLRLLEILKKASVTILYVVPDRDILTMEERENENLTFSALQDIVRTGDLDRIYLVDLGLVEDYLGDVPLQNFDTALVQTISSTFAMLNYFDHTEPLKTNKKEMPVAVRISTFGLLDSEDKEHLFYNLENVKDKEYFYGVTKEDMKKSSLLREIRSRTKSLAKDARCYYSIHSIESDNIQKYVRAHTDRCQIRNEKIDDATP